MFIRFEDNTEYSGRMLKLSDLEEYYYEDDITDWLFICDVSENKTKKVSLENLKKYLNK